MLINRCQNLPVQSSPECRNRPQTYFIISYFASVQLHYLTTLTLLVESEAVELQWRKLQNQRNHALQCCLLAGLQ